VIDERCESDDCIKCESCGKFCKIISEPHKFEVHHKRPVFRTTIHTWEDVWNPDNLIILCIDCHNKTKKYKVEKPTYFDTKKQKQIMIWC
jgi:5-methylcytosine-specific restriction endonuclease McrA